MGWSRKTVFWMIASCACAVPGCDSGLTTCTPLAIIAEVVSADSAPAGKPTQIIRQVNSQGKLMPARGIARLSALPGDRVESILVKPGDRVINDQVLAVLKSQTAKKLELEAAELKYAEAQSLQDAKLRELALAVSMAKSRVVAAQQSIEIAQSQRRLANLNDQQIDRLRKQVEAMKRLREDPLTRAAVGRLEVESKELEVEKLSATAEQSQLTAENGSKQASLQLKQAEESLVAAEEAHKTALANSTLESLSKSIELLKLQWLESSIRAPYESTILNIVTEVGERTSTLPVLEVADLSKIVCMAEVYEADVGRIQLGDSARMKSAALEADLIGRVIRIDRIVGASQMRSPNPMARTDFRSVAVWIEIASESTPIAADRLQLQVDVQIAVAK